MIRIDFPDFLTFLDDAESGTSDSNVNAYAWATHSDRGAGYSGGAGTKTFADAVHLARFGDTQREARIRSFAEGLVPPPGSIRESLTGYYDVSGEGVDMSLYMAGETSCMTNYEFDHRPEGKILSVGVDIGANCNISASAMERRGAAICCLIDTLEANGYRIELTACFFSRMADSVGMSILVKQAQESLDITRLSYMGHPSMFRRHALAATGKRPECVRALGATGGGTLRRPADWIFDLWIEEDYSPFYSDEEARAWLRRTITKYSNPA